MLSESHSISMKLWNSKIEAIKVLEIDFWRNQSATWSETVISFHAGNFRGILGIHPIKSFSGDKLVWFDQKIDFFLIKKTLSSKETKSICQKI